MYYASCAFLWTLIYVSFINIMSTHYLFCILLFRSHRTKYYNLFLRASLIYLYFRIAALKLDISKSNIPLPSLKLHIKPHLWGKGPISSHFWVHTNGCICAGYKLPGQHPFNLHFRSVTLRMVVRISVGLCLKYLHTRACVFVSMSPPNFRETKKIKQHCHFIAVL